MFAIPATDALAYLFSPNTANFLSVAAWSIVPSSFLTANLFLSSCVNWKRKLLGNVFSSTDNGRMFCSNSANKSFWLNSPLTISDSLFLTTDLPICGFV